MPRLKATPGADTVSGCVQALAKTCPDRLFARLVSNGRTDEEISYHTLYQRALQWAACIKSQGVREHEVVVLIFGHDPVLFYAWLGVVLAGAVPAIFAHPSGKVPMDLYQKNVRAMLQACQTRWLCVASEYRLSLRESIPADVTLLDPGLCRQDSGSPEPAFKDAPSRTLVLQHTSGTTGLRKGVALTNAQILHQLRHYAEALRMSPEDKIVSWLPLYHDMGLLTCFLLPLTCGIPVTMMSPFEWIAEPRKLFRVITKERSTLCWLPNFAFNILASTGQPQEESFDLRSMRAFINCSEPIQARSLDLFRETCRPLGLHPDALSTSYAMAENTFAVTQGGMAEPVVVDDIDASVWISQGRAVPVPPGSLQSRKWVSSGKPLEGNHVRIVDEELQDRPDRYEGEILIRSDSLFEGYFGQPDQTAAVLHQGWYSTGDLGYQADGQLFVTGRKKDLIIVAGKNIYPQDIEEIVSSIKGIYPGRVASFGLDNEATGTQDIVVLAETDVRDRPGLLQLRLSIAKAIHQNLECAVSEICLLPRQSLLKSTSGKISRAANAAKYADEWRRAYVVS